MTRILQTEIKTGERLVATDITDLTFFPKGTILTFSSEAWSATSAEFKEIWKICNGQNGTPDLRNKFLRGAESSGATSDGKKTLSVNELPSHKHRHTHGTHIGTFPVRVYREPSSVSGVFALNGEDFSDDGWEGWAPSHGVTMTAAHSYDETPAGGGEAFDVIPAFYAVIYIMKVA